MTAHNQELQPDVIIVGGGIVGCALAYDLTLMGVRVLLLERRELAREASWASAGIIVPADPSMGKRVPMALMAYRRYPELVSEVEHATGMSTGFNPTGELMAAMSDDVERLQELQAWQQQQGVATEWLDDRAVREREPALHERYIGGLLTPDTATIRLDRFSLALARAAALRGAVIQEFTTVTGIIHSAGRATGVRTQSGDINGGVVVVAAGAWSGGILESVDVSIPTHPVMGQMMAITNPPVPIRSVISAAGGYLIPRADGSIAVAATVEPEAGYDNRVTPAGARELIERVAFVAPALLQGTLDSTWAGLRPGSGDDELIVGRLPHLDNLWVAAGHFRTGALLGPATSLWLAQSIMAGTLVDSLAPFSPARFL